jgi:hypothetical protein
MAKGDNGSLAGGGRLVPLYPIFDHTDGLNFGQLVCNKARDIRLHKCLGRVDCEGALHHTER